MSHWGNPAPILAKVPNGSVGDLARHFVTQESDAWIDCLGSSGRGS